MIMLCYIPANESMQVTKLVKISVTKPFPTHNEISVTVIIVTYIYLEQLSLQLLLQNYADRCANLC